MMIYKIYPFNNVMIIPGSEHECTNYAPWIPTYTQGTFELAIASSRPYLNKATLFGSWVECGTEDKDLEEIYQTRLVPSSKASE